MSELDVLTVVELKQLLSDKGLAISGNKSELIERLMSIEEQGISEPSVNMNPQLPFLKSLFHDGFSSVKFDRRLTIRYAAAVFMLIFIIIGLNSNSWYFMEFTTTDGDPDMGIYVDEKTSLNFGLGDFELAYSANGMGWGGPMSSETSQILEYDGEECKSTNEFSCDSFAIAGNLNKIILGITILCILIIIGLGINRGLGKKLTPMLAANEKRILDISWAATTILPIISTLCYRVIVAFSEMDLQGWDNDGFGFMWWCMMVVPLAFFGLIHKEQISSAVAKLKQNR